jgi:hypothetical protein
MEEIDGVKKFSKLETVPQRIQLSYPVSNWSGFIGKF